MGTILTLAVALLVVSSVQAQDFRNVTCEGTYPHHLQGICTDDKDSLYWSFTTTLAKTDLNGKLQKQDEK